MNIPRHISAVVAIPPYQIYKIIYYTLFQYFLQLSYECEKSSNNKFTYVNVLFPVFKLGLTQYLKNILFSFLLLAAIHAQIQLPVSNCLGNCISCHPEDALTCVKTINLATDRQTFCVPFYTGSGNNCTTGGSFFVLLLLS